MKATVKTIPTDNGGFGLVRCAFARYALDVYPIGTDVIAYRICWARDFMRFDRTMKVGEFERVVDMIVQNGISRNDNLRNVENVIAMVRRMSLRAIDKSV